MMFPSNLELISYPHQAMNYIVFDIETAPLPEEQIASMIPPFDEAEVKVGNIKDPALIAEKIAKAKEKHISDFIDKAALSAVSGRVVAIGYKFDRGHEIHASAEPEGEAGILAHFWKVYVDCVTGHGQTIMIGHNIFDFDLPFIIHRSWALGIAIPPGVFSIRGRYPNWSDAFQDTRVLFMLGKKEGKSSLDTLSRFFGFEGKDETGKNFHLWLKEDPEKAKDYLLKDLELTEAIARKMGAILK